MSNSRSGADLTNLAWEHLLAGRHELALDTWSQLIQKADQLRVRMDRGWARLYTRDWDGALEDFLRAREIGLPQHPVVVREVGVALWLLGERQAACEDWAQEIARRRAGEFYFLDAAGGVQVPSLLWWASAHPGLAKWRDAAAAELEDRWNAKEYEPRGWPRPIAGYLLGFLDESEFLTTAQSPTVRLQQRRQCVAHFYVGAKSLAAGDLQCYREGLAETLNYGENVIDSEFRLARGELAPGGSLLTLS